MSSFSSPSSSSDPASYSPSPSSSSSRTSLYLSSAYQSSASSSSLYSSEYELLYVFEPVTFPPLWKWDFDLEDEGESGPKAGYPNLSAPGYEVVEFCRAFFEKKMLMSPSQAKTKANALRMPGHCLYDAWRFDLERLVGTPYGKTLHDYLKQAPEHITNPGGHHAYLLQTLPAHLEPGHINHPGHSPVLMPQTPRASLEPEHINHLGYHTPQVPDSLPDFLDPEAAYGEVFAWCLSYFDHRRVLTSEEVIQKAVAIAMPAGSLYLLSQKQMISAVGKIEGPCFFSHLHDSPHGRRLREEGLVVSKGPGFFRKVLGRLWHSVGRGMKLI
ncbi:MAG: hypothetical protein M4579_000673 [Chaenotheca gracillima]|nr:MAG: hypothetical protein M4579_000673 [Chaenotheca gracillima]